MPDGLAKPVMALSDNPAGTPLDLLPGLTERGISGRMSLIVEGMPVGSFLSAGTNNWDNTWSLKAITVFANPSGIRAVSSHAIRAGPG